MNVAQDLFLLFEDYESIEDMYSFMVFQLLE